MRGSGGLSPARSGARERRAVGVSAGRGFSLVDVLVSIGVMAILIAILLPSISKVRESARRSVCASNLRQVGIGTHIFAGQNDDRIPGSVFLDPEQARTRNLPPNVAPWFMMQIHLPTIGHIGGPRSGIWDGIGHLYEDAILPAGAIFYCPSHQGVHTFERYSERFASSRGEVFSNYQYRGEGPNGRRRIDLIEPGAALVVDAIAGEQFFNHLDGFNVLRVDHSVGWLPDQNGELAEALAASAFDDNIASISEAWQKFDTSGGD